MDLDDVLRILDALERGGVRYAGFGGLAMAAHGFDRATRDLDLFVPPDERNIERLRTALSSVFEDHTIDDAQRLARAFGFDDLGER